MISYSLCGDIGSTHVADTELGFENYIAAARRRARPRRRRAGGGVRRFVRRIRRAALRSDASGRVSARWCWRRRPRRAGSRTRSRRAGCAGRGCRHPRSSPPRRFRLWPEVCATASRPHGAPSLLRSPGTARGGRADDAVAHGARAFARRSAIDFRADCARVDGPDARRQRRGRARSCRTGDQHSNLRIAHSQCRATSCWKGPGTSACSRSRNASPTSDQ